MLLEDLRVLHLAKKAEKRVDFDLANAFRVETCQRVFWVAPSSVIGSLLDPAFELYAGTEAYRFLLQIATGLESEVRGETDIFGQLKAAWATFENDQQSNRNIISELRFWIQRVFEDTKEIRARYMQNVGGASYGSLVRMILKEVQEGPEEPILLVGAGKLASSILPWLDDHELWLVNRSEEGLQKLESELNRRPGARFRSFRTPEEQEYAWAHAAHVVICIPVDEKNDEWRIRLLKSGKAPQTRQILHLGATDLSRTSWSNLPNLSTLENIFARQRHQEAERGNRFLRAEQACVEKARLRELSSESGGPVSLPHGWEDLAVFARIG
jgi:hypothetical protein